MDLRYTAAEQAFRDELRHWLAATLPDVGRAPPPHDDWPARRAYDLRWQRLLFDAGYAGVDWPAEGGGRGASPVEQLIFKEECERAGAPYVGVNFVGLLHAGPTIIAEGTPRAEGALPAGHPARRGGVVPGLQRARRRERPGLAAHPGRARRRRLRRDRVEDLDVARRGGRLLRAARAHRRRRQPRHHAGSSCRWTRRGSRSGRCAPSKARPSSPSCSSTRCASRWPTGWARRTTAGG